jgi:hypothetical protein
MENVQKRLAIRFLKERGLYISWKKNIIEQNNLYRLLKVDFFNGRFIDKSFRWYDTKEGYYFWSSLNEEYNKYYSNNIWTKR